MITPSDFVQELRKAFTDRGFERKGLCFYLRSAEVVWVIEPERVFSGSGWALRLGCLVRSINQDLPFPRENQCHLTSDYAFISDSMPDSAVAYRFNDHRSYFAMAFSLEHGIMADSERLSAVRFAASDLRTHLDSLMDIKSIACAASMGLFENGFLDPRLRALF